MSDIPGSIPWTIARMQELENDDDAPACVYCWHGIDRHVPRFGCEGCGCGVEPDTFLEDFDGE